MAVDEKLVVLADEVYQANIWKKGASFSSFKKVRGAEMYDGLMYSSFVPMLTKIIAHQIVIVVRSCGNHKCWKWSANRVLIMIPVLALARDKAHAYLGTSPLLSSCTGFFAQDAQLSSSVSALRTVRVAWS